MDQKGDRPHLLDRFAAIVGESHVLRDPKDIAPRLVENRGLYKGVSPMVLKPGSTVEVAAILKLATETGTAIVPQTGNTGLEIGRASVRERVCENVWISVVAVSIKKKNYIDNKIVLQS